MWILPVLDLFGGIVVRGVAGKRDEYRPIVSRLAANPDPLEIGLMFRRDFGLDTLYLADLDAILHERPNWDVYRQLGREGFRLWVDAGLRSVEAAERLLAAGATTVVAGLETWPGPQALVGLCRSVGAEQTVFSLDLQQGRPMGDLSAWRTGEPVEIVDQAAAAGVTTLIVLDLAHVGVNQGIGTLPLCSRLRERHPRLRLVTGGGIRHASDLVTLKQSGISAALVASALHDGRVTRPDLERICGKESPILDPLN